MIPETVGAILGLLLVIGPGIAFEVIREHYKPTAERSAFRELSAVALASLAFTFVALLILWAARARWPSLLPDPRAWILAGKTYVADHFIPIARFFVALAAISTGLASLVSWLWFRSGDGRINPNTTAWFELFRNRVPTGATPMVRARLTDQTEYIGTVVYYSANILPAERELVLGPPLQRKVSDSDGFESLPDGDAWSRLVLPGPSVQSLWVRYAPKGDP